jgi:glycerophosphoryl diester phosphodiesterase
MISAIALGSDIAGGLRRYTGPLLTYHLFFSLLTLALLAPSSAWLLTAVLTSTGHPVVSDEDIVRFMLSPPGALWILVAGTLAALIVFLEHAGLMLIASDPSAGRYQVATGALWQTGRLLHRLLTLAGLMVAAHMAAAAPFVLGILGSYALLLGDLDPYFLVTQRPPIVWLFLASAAPFVLGLAIVNGGLYVRWILALPALAFEQLGPRAALRRSADLTAGSRLRIAGFVLGMAMLVSAMPLLLSIAFDGLGRILLGPLPERFVLLVPAILVYLALYIGLAFMVTFLAVGLNSMLVYKLYLRAT